MHDSSINFADTLVQDGRPDRTEGRHVNMPLELSSTMVFDTLAEFESARDARYAPGTLYYGRYGNAAVYKLEALLAKLERTEMVTLTSSGVAAISTTLMALTAPGSHILVADNVYGNTRAFCDGLLTRQGVTVDYFDPMIGGRIAGLITETTAAIVFETPGSGTFEMPDIRAICNVARAANVPTVLDNTWGAPMFVQPLTLGVDVVVYSGSKYVSGHSDCMLGVTASAKEIGTRIRKTVMQIGDKTGGQEVLLALRGLRTLKLRLEAIDRAGREMAHWLADQPQVKRVLHPALPSCPGHEHWARDFSGAAGLFGVIFHTTSDDAVRRFVDSLHHFGIGVSWGGYESLALPVIPLRSAKPWTEPGRLVRFNIGLEDPASLKADLAAALPLLDP
ncbi:cystathionine beta-lyase [Pacificoceanicola onchidii]|uniref:cystathionine beta-lyase n=1 Tax=Pacificoceanicola onchidii TaxID=2562685 RepID=UPI0014560437|nr:cystathionine beta-lyase [Pacificoceanicola onchidii]